MPEICGEQKKKIIKLAYELFVSGFFSAPPQQLIGPSDADPSAVVKQLIQHTAGKGVFVEI